MRSYETMVVLSNELGGELDNLVTRLKSLIQENGGNLAASHDWGTRRLAYSIHKQSDGRYFLFEYDAEPDVVRELERTLRITDGVLRYLSVQQEHTGLPPERRREATGRDQTPLHEVRSMPDRGRHARDDEAARNRGDETASPAVEPAGKDVEGGEPVDGDGAKSNE